MPRRYPEAPPPPEPTEDRLTFSANELRAILHEEITDALGVQKIAYSTREAAVATGVSPSLIQAAVKRNDLVASYAGSKPLFAADELKRWVESLPNEPWRITYR